MIRLLSKITKPSVTVMQALCVLGAIFALSGCERQPEPLRIGMVASLTGRTADIGVAARDGALLAIEQANLNGGVNGRRLELVVEDDANDPGRAEPLLRQLTDAGVFVSIGPVLSSMAIEMAPLAAANGMLLVSPTVSTDWLGEKDDLFVRVYPQSRDTSHSLAAHVFRQGYRRIAIMTELTNSAFTQAWHDTFQEKFEQLGGEVVASVGFRSGNSQDFRALAIRASQAHPDSLLILSSAIDAAMIAQQIAKVQPGLKMFVSEWSFTRDLLVHGGRAVEGVTLFQTYNEQSQNQRFVQFVSDFQQRFARPPEFPAVHAYDATRLVLTGLRTGARSGVALKQALLQLGEFGALQSTFTLNRYGDVNREFYLTEVVGGKFVVTGAPQR